MITAQALDIVLKMARSSRGGALREREVEAIEEVEELLSSYENNDYKDEDYLEDKLED
jgi:hypothetical protein